MDILMSIKPQFAEKIFTGQKEVEFRKTSPLKFKLITELVFVYCTIPVKKIIGHFSVRDIIIDSPENLWKKYQKVGGIGEKEFFDYFQEKKVGYAIEVNLYRRYNAGIDLKALDPNQKITPPQSYIYLNSHITLKILEIANAQ